MCEDTFKCNERVIFSLTDHSIDIANIQYLTSPSPLVSDSNLWSLKSHIHFPMTQLHVPVKITAYITEQQPGQTYTPLSWIKRHFDPVQIFVPKSLHSVQITASNVFIAAKLDSALLSIWPLNPSRPRCLQEKKKTALS